MDSETPDTKRLDRLRSRARQTGGYSPLYSKIVRTLRLLLPVIAVVIVSVVIIWMSIGEDDIAVNQDQKSMKEAAHNELISPNFQSVDEKDQPFTFSAVKATQGGEDDNLVFLEAPEGRLLMNSGDEIHMNALTGYYEQNLRRLFLKDDVIFFDSENHKLRMAELHIDLDKSIAWCDVPVAGEGPEGHLTAQGLQAASAQDVLILKGPAKLVLYQTDAKPVLSF